MQFLKKLPEILAPNIKEGAKIIIWFFLIASVVIFSLHAMLSISHPYSLDYGEAPLINQASPCQKVAIFIDPALKSPLLPSPTTRHCM